MIELAEARHRLLALGTQLSAETHEIQHCSGRYLARDITARRTQPAADMSAMDGYAVRFGDLGEAMQIIGESAAGRPFAGGMLAGQAVRIFTGAHMPARADSVLIQEDAEAQNNVLRMVGDGPKQRGENVRKTGSDFTSGDILLRRGHLLHAGAIATAVMGGYGELDVGRRPKVIVIGSGDELVMAGAMATPAQIPASNNNMLCAMLQALPCEVIDAGIVGDSMDSIVTKFAQHAGADIIVTSGGASVGDHDLIQAALISMGAEIDFWRVAIKPGKPMMAGRLGGSIVIGLPGNPGSAFVTAFLFLLPLVRHLAGSNAPWPAQYSAITQTDMPATGTRTEFLRALVNGSEITPLLAQDSGITHTLAAANALLIRTANADAAIKGQLADYLLI
jgi:molybdopterin molybdotransferase